MPILQPFQSDRCNAMRRVPGTVADGCPERLRFATPPAAAPEPGSLEAEILGLMQGQQKIKAIKLYRQRTGVGLKEAKDFVEALAAKHGVAPAAAVVPAWSC